MQRCCLLTYLLTYLMLYVNVNVRRACLFSCRRYWLHWIRRSAWRTGGHWIIRRYWLFRATRTAWWAWMDRTTWLQRWAWSTWSNRLTRIPRQSHLLYSSVNHSVVFHVHVCVYDLKIKSNGLHPHRYDSCPRRHRFTNRPNVNSTVHRHVIRNTA